MQEVRIYGRLIAGFLAALAMSVSSGAATSDYPDKPVRMVVPFAPGGTTDIVARVVAQKLGEIWKKQVVIDNRGGAGGSIGTDLAAKAPADGYRQELIAFVAAEKVLWGEVVREVMSAKPASAGNP